MWGREGVSLTAEVRHLFFFFFILLSPFVCPPPPSPRAHTRTRTPFCTNNVNSPKTRRGVCLMFEWNGRKILFTTSSACGRSWYALFGTFPLPGPLLLQQGDSRFVSSEGFSPRCRLCCGRGAGAGVEPRCGSPGRAAAAGPGTPNSEPERFGGGRPGRGAEGGGAFSVACSVGEERRGVGAEDLDLQGCCEWGSRPLSNSLPHREPRSWCVRAVLGRAGSAPVCVRVCDMCVCAYVHTSTYVYRCVCARIYACTHTYTECTHAVKQGDKSVQRKGSLCPAVPLPSRFLGNL